MANIMLIYLEGGLIKTPRVSNNPMADIMQGHPTRNNTIKAQNAVFCFLISHYGL